MSLLFKHLRVHQIFGANTDVGKTLLTTALAKASVCQEKPVFYLKPISTGPLHDSDHKHIERFTKGYPGSSVTTKCLYRYHDPVSPHLAAKMAEDKNVPSDQTFVNSVAEYIRQCASESSQLSHMYVETAGGIHSPTLSGTTQVDAYRPLFLPTILVGDSKLGGISSTISAYESLLLRGYIIDGVLLFRDEYYRNWEYLKEYFADRDVFVSTVDGPPDKSDNPIKNFEVTDRYYNNLVHGSARDNDGLGQILAHLDSRHRRRIEELDSMPRRTLDSVWWPFVQHGLYNAEKDVMVIDSAYSDYFSIRSSNSDRLSLLHPQFDGSASWWTQTFGHFHPSLTLAAARAAGRYGHVMFPRATHLPALRLAEYLVKEGPGKGWASRAFFSDDGATGMEVALKMALRAYSSRTYLNEEERKSLGVLGLKGSYHGDTIGAMDACEDVGVYTCEWHNAKGYWLDPPSVSIQNGKAVITIPSGVSSSDSGEEIVRAESLSWIYDVESRLASPQADLYRDFIRRVLKHLPKSKTAALVLEPLVLGAGGMIFVDPLFQRVLVDIARSQPYNLPVIFDEVFVGLYRIGVETTTSILGVHPDISVNAKILTGGLVPLAVTLARESVFNAFLSEKKAEALLHGHSYTAHAVGCEVANEALRMLKKVVGGNDWKEAKRKWGHSDEGESVQPEKAGSRIFSLWDPGFVDAVSKNEKVKEVMTLGTILAIKLADGNDAGYTSHSAESMFRNLNLPDVLSENTLSAAPGGAPFGVHFRTLGNVAYFMSSLNTLPETLRSLEDKIWRILR
ncbi:PLP-dependent transferase [Marasmius fiardii PR-910]|nr:PLP-dependent transferase [Marasmius fiardii PR-910]